jgi:DNA-binding transcriptional MerR regulator
MSERTHLSIGEVLSLLQDEFPDITISKIRFLESQGLLDPERTPSGYRKFYENDIERLRWILRQQRENFLPLKVIKDRLAAGELDEPEPANSSKAVSDDEAGPDPSPPDVSDNDKEPASTRVRGATGATAGKKSAEAATGSSKSSSSTSNASPRASSTKRSSKRTRAQQGSLLDVGESSVSMSLDELVAATGLTPRAVADLERFGLLTSRALGATSYYDEHALVVARLAATFLSHGVEPRHLRMYKVAAEREAGMFEQLVMPLLKQRNPSARQEAVELLGDLAGLGDQLRAAMLREALREYLGHG